MSWTAWTDRLLTRNSHTACDKAWITDLGGIAWAYSDKEGHDDAKRPVLNILCGQFLMGEFKTIKDMIQGACSPAEGLTLAGNKFLVIKVVAGDCVLCKKGQAGLTIAKSMQCMVFGMYDAESNVNPGNNTAQVTHIRDELIKCGF